MEVSVGPIAAVSKEMRFLQEGRWRKVNSKLEKILLIVTLLPLTVLFFNSPLGASTTQFIFIDGDELPSVMKDIGDRQLLYGRELRDLLEFVEKEERVEEQKELSPPAPFIIRSADYRGKVVDDAARFTAVYELYLFVDDEVLFSPPSEDLAILGAKVDGVAVDMRVPAFELSKNGSPLAPWLPIQGVGIHRVELSFFTPVSRFGETASLTMACPRTAIGSFRLTVDEADAKVEVVPSTGMKILESKADSTSVECGLPYYGTIFARWSHHREQVPKEKIEASKEEAKEEPLLFDSKVIAKALVQEAWLAVESRFNYLIKRGKLRALKLNMPAKGKILSVQGKNIRKWRLQGDSLLIDLETAFDKSYELRVRTAHDLPEESIEEDGIKAMELDLLAPCTAEAATEKGYLCIETSDDGEVLPGSHPALTRVDPLELKHRVDISSVDLAYKFLDSQWQLPLSIIRRPRVEATDLRIKSSIIEARVTEDGTLLVKQSWSFVNNGAQFLEVQLPPSSGLMSCFVKNEARAAGRGEKESSLKIPLVKSQGKAGNLKAFPVEISYASYIPELSLSGDTKLLFAKVEATVSQCRCKVYAPQNYVLIPEGGTFLWRGENSLSKWFKDVKKAAYVLGFGGCLVLSRGQYREREAMDVSAPLQQARRRDSGTLSLFEPSTTDDLAQPQELAAPSPSLARKEEAPLGYEGKDMADDGAGSAAFKSSLRESHRRGERRRRRKLAKKRAHPRAVQKTISQEERERAKFMATISKSSARKGNLPVRIVVDQGKIGSSYSFSQELIDPRDHAQSISLSYVHSSFILALENLNVLLGTALGLLLIVFRKEREKSIIFLVCIFILVILDSIAMYTVPELYLLNYLLLSIPCVAGFYLLRFLDDIMSTLICLLHRKLR